MEWRKYLEFLTIAKLRILSWAGKHCKYTENFCTSLKKGILFIVLISELMSSWKIQLNKGRLNKYHIYKSYLKLYVSPYNSWQSWLALRAIQFWGCSAENIMEMSGLCSFAGCPAARGIAEYLYYPTIKGGYGW